MSYQGLLNQQNKDSTKIKQKIRILNHPKKLIKVLRARLAITKGLTGNNITTGPNQYRFTRTFLDGVALRIFDLKSTELRHELARGEQGKSTQINRDWTKKRSGIAAPISLEELMEKEAQSST